MTLTDRMRLRAKTKFVVCGNLALRFRLEVWAEDADHAAEIVTEYSFDELGEGCDDTYPPPTVNITSAVSKEAGDE